jgi:hypothetical protein
VAARPKRSAGGWWREYLDLFFVFFCGSRYRTWPAARAEAHRGHDEFEACIKLSSAAIGLSLDGLLALDFKRQNPMYVFLGIQ